MMSNKKRSIMTILGVIISVAMITAVSTAVVTFLDLLQRMEMDNYGAWHVQYIDLPVDNIASLESKENVENIFYTKDLGYGKIVDTKTNNAYKPYLYIERFTTDAMNQMSLKLIEGRFPTNENEIVLPEHLKDDGGIAYEVGGTIDLSIGDRYIGEYSEESLLYQNNPYTLELPEEFMVKESKTYQIVGIIKRPSFEEYSAPGYTAITYLDMESITEEDTVNTFLFINNVTRNIYRQSNEIGHKLGVSDFNILFNDDVLVFYGVSEFDTFNQMLNGLAFILILIIMVGSVSLIYNSFAISITERSKQFGMLASVGATKKQKRNAIFYEGGVIGIIAIPLGVLVGILGMAITFRLVGAMLTNSLGILVPLQMKVSLTSIIVAVVFSILTIFISAMIPAKRASRISPMDAIRQTKDIKLQKKAMKTSRLTRYIFGLEGDLAQKNLKRNKKRYKALIFSLLISLILFISVGSYTFYLSKSLKMTLDRSNFDLAVSIDSEESQTGIIEALRQVEGVKEGTKIAYPTLDIAFDDNFVKVRMTEQFREMKKEVFRSRGWAEDEIIEYMKEYGNDLYAQLIIVDDATYSDFAQQAGVKANVNDIFTIDGKTKVQNNNAIKGILINRHQEKVGYSLLESDVLNINLQDEFSIFIKNYEESDNEATEIQADEEERIEIPVELLSITDQLPIGLSYAAVDEAIHIIISEATYLELMEQLLYEVNPNVNITYYFNLSKPQGIEERIRAALKQYTSSTLYITNRYEEALQNKQLMTVMSIFAYGFITLISLICMTNLCNTIATSFALRRREFAMLKSVGMTPKSFYRMIRFESLLYGVKALLYGLPVSLFITYTIFQVVDSNFSSDFLFPWATYLVGILSVFLVVGVAMLYSTYKVKDESIIDGLKSEIE